VQRHPALAVPLGAGHLGAAEAARALHPDAEGAGLLGVLHGALHGPAEGHAAGELVGDALGDERGVELGLLDLLDVELDLGLPVILVSPARRRSASLPRRPMTMPGRAVCTSTRSLSRVRSTSMRLIAACGSSVMR
jgi:hypothetical protein